MAQRSSARLPRSQPAQREDRDVVVLRRVADELLEPLDEAADDARGGRPGAASEVRLEPPRVELLLGRIARLDV